MSQLLDSAKRGWNRVVGQSRSDQSPQNNLQYNSNTNNNMTRMYGGMYGEEHDDDEDQQCGQIGAEDEFDPQDDNVMDEEEMYDYNGEEDDGEDEEPYGSLAANDARDLSEELSRRFQLPIHVQANAIYSDGVTYKQPPPKNTCAPSSHRPAKTNTKAINSQMHGGSTNEFSKTGRPLSRYQSFMKIRLPQVKEENPHLSHTEAFSQAARDWNDAK